MLAKANYNNIYKCYEPVKQPILHVRHCKKATKHDTLLKVLSIEMELHLSVNYCIIMETDNTMLRLSELNNADVNHFQKCL